MAYLTSLRDMVVQFDYTYPDGSRRMRHSVVTGVDFGSPGGPEPEDPPQGLDRFYLRCIALDLPGRPDRSFDMARIDPATFVIL